MKGEYGCFLKRGRKAGRSCMNSENIPSVAVTDLIDSGYIGTQHIQGFYEISIIKM
jgi:hypothetical protein